MKEVCAVFEVLDQEVLVMNMGRNSHDWSVATTLEHGSSGTTAGDGIWNGTSSVVPALAKEEDCSSSEGTVVSSGGAGGNNVGCN